MPETENKNGSKIGLIVVPVIVALISCLGLIASTLINKIQIPAAPTFTPTPLPINHAIIKFVVFDKTTQKNILGAKIILQIGIMPSQSDITDTDGVARFFLNPEYIGLHGFLQIEADGYKSQKRDIDINEKEPFEIYLEPEKPISSQTPTDTITLTNTPTKTPIPPTATISPPNKVLDYLNGVEVVYHETFDNPTASGWGFDIGEIKNGSLEIVGDNWRGFSRYEKFSENQGIILDFTYTQGSQFVVAITNGVFGSDQHKQLAIRIMNDEASVIHWNGEKDSEKGKLLGNLTLAPNRTYQFLVTALPNGEFLVVIWDWADTSKTYAYRERISENWSNLDWKLEIVANKGTILFDNCRDIKFDSVK